MMFHRNKSAIIGSEVPHPARPSTRAGLPHGLVAKVATVIVAFAFSAAPAVSQADVDLNAIRKALEFHSRSINTLEGAYRWRMKPQYEGPLIKDGNSLVMEDLHGTAQFAVDLRRGAVYLERTKTFHYSRLSPTEFIVRSVNTFDGQTGYGLIFTPQQAPFLEIGPPPNVPHLLNIRLKNETTLYILPHDLAGLRLTRLHSSFPPGGLADLFRSHRARLEGRERIGGVSCYRVSVTAKGPGRLTVWLDPQHGFLPRRLEHSTEREASAKVEVFQFREFPDQATGNRLWFPVRGRWETALNVHDVEIDALQINPAIDVGRFRIDPSSLPDGVMVVDQLKGQRWVTGGRTDLWEERNRLEDAHTARCQAVLAKNTGRATDDAVRASGLGGRSWFFWALGATSIVLLAAGIYLLIRKRQMGL